MKAGMRVLFVSHWADNSGAEQALFELVRYLAGRDVHAMVVFPHRTPIVDQIAAQGISVRTLPFRWWVNWTRRPAWRLALTAGKHLVLAVRLALMAKRWGADVVYTNTVTPCIGALGARLSKLPHVWHLHEYGEDDHGFTFEFGDIMSFRVMRACTDRIIVNSQSVRDHYAKALPDTPMLVAEYAVSVPDKVLPAETWADAEGNAKVLKAVVVGFVKEGKRQVDAVAAIAECARRGIDVRLTLVGRQDPEYLKRILDLAEIEGVKARLSLVGWTDNPYGHIAAADVLVVPSAREAFGRVTVEAMKIGTAVVASNSGGTAERVRHGETGLLYEVGNVRELADALMRLHEDVGLRARLARLAAEEAGERYTLERYGNPILNVLQELTAREAAQLRKRRVKSS